MPELDGFAATEAIRAREGTGRRTPIIALTASALLHERERCLQVGMDDFLPKPIMAEALAAMLARWLPSPAGLAPAAAPGARESSCHILDRAALEEMLGMPLEDAADVMVELVGLYRQNASCHYVTLRAALTAGELRVVRSTAHALAGGSAHLGLVAFTR